MSNEIKCPNCGKVFKVDETNFQNIVSLIRDDIFEKQVNEKVNEKMQNEILQTKLNEQKIANKKIQEVEDINKELYEKVKNMSIEIEKLNANKKNDILESKKPLEEQIIDLNNKIKNFELEKSSAIEKSTRGYEIEINNLKNELETSKAQNKLEIANLEKRHSESLKSKDEEIRQWKDFKHRMSTKQVGEDLEQWCKTEFDKIRAGAFPNAHFEKDNNVVDGGKGDFIFRENDQNNVEIISIMLEMKNETDTTSTKKKNEDFFDKLDKDRNNKKCEYAILVSQLEPDNNFYNQGIVQAPTNKYSKMYVVRPENFITLITLLRNNALNNIQYKNQLKIYEQQNYDISGFETKLGKFKDVFGKHWNAAQNKYNDAIKDIDATITKLQKIRDELTSSSKQLEYANNDLQDLTIKKLTHNNPTMKKKFDEAREKDKLENNNFDNSDSNDEK